MLFVTFGSFPHHHYENVVHCWPTGSSCMVSRPMLLLAYPEPVHALVRTEKEETALQSLRSLYPNRTLRLIDSIDPYAEQLKPVLRSPAHEIIPGLYLGDAESSRDGALHRERGIKYIVNAAEECQNVFSGVTYLNIPLQDIPQARIDYYFVQCHQFIEKALTEGASVLVHCRAGISRSATLVISYLMKAQGLSFKDAYLKVQSVRSCIEPNAGFCRQLQLYGDTLHGTQK